MATIIIGGFGLALAGSYFEKRVLPDMLPALFEPSTIYKAKAEKDGEENCEARYSLPNLYVAGSTKHSKAFNCWQRSHQQALETLPQVYATTLFAGLAFPVTTTLGGLWWLAGRITWATGYAASEGNPAARYSHPLAKGIWSGYMVNLGLAVMTAVNFSGLYNFW
eukprot:gene21836-8905_t